MDNRYLLEVGTEELPPGFMETLPAELADKITEALIEAKITPGHVTVHTTPRRIAIELEGLVDKQASREALHKGPPLRIAVDDSGNPTKAGEAFARKLGVPFEQLKHETVGKEICLTHTQHVPGQPVGQLLSEILPDLILGLNGPRFMRWGEGENIRFARPIRWLVSLWNQDHLPIQMGDVQSSNQSRGHRFLCQEAVNIPSAKDYRETLNREGHVIVEREKRLDIIRKQLKIEAEALGGNDPALNPANDNLFEEVAKIVEFPWVFSGSFDKGFLELPKEVIITVMAAHQKYFPVENTDGTLQSHFLVVSNAHPNAVDTIRKGNERVLKARLEDARYFFDDDRKKTLVERLDDLKGITFQRGLGTMFDKTQRLIVLTRFIADALDYDKETTAQAVEAAQLSKADLVTGMVFELTELQGVMGRIYAQREGINPSVCQAIEDQYIYQASEFASWSNQPVSITLSLADKIDTMVAVFSQEKAKMPTGSKDPLGLRRMANSIIGIMMETSLILNLTDVITKAYETIELKDKASLETVQARFSDFMMQRFKAILLDDGYRYDMIDAVMETEHFLENMTQVVTKIGALKRLMQEQKPFNALYEPANRIFKILGKNYRADTGFDEIQEQYLIEPSEKALYKAFKDKSLESQMALETLIKGLEELSPLINVFFENVLVNDKDEMIRQNRYNLLSMLNRCYLRLGNFTKLVMN